MVAHVGRCTSWKMWLEGKHQQRCKCTGLERALGGVVAQGAGQWLYGQTFHGGCRGLCWGPTHWRYTGAMVWLRHDLDLGRYDMRFQTLGNVQGGSA